MNISLTNELEEFVHGKIQTGRYLSASEVVREALRLLEERDKMRELKMRQLREDITSAVDELDRGESVAFDPARIKAKGSKLLQERRGKGNEKSSPGSASGR
jgi:antitoxin ParD1/3/4